MNPLHFGNSQRPLFGVYHPPGARSTSPRGAVLCYPFGQEYMRSHRAFRQLAVLLSRRGIPAFRFDYFGTGDSTGDAEDADVGQWVADIGSAVDELRDTAGVSAITLVGLRLGASLATMAAAARADVDRLVLWDPVVDGARYLDEIFRTRTTRSLEQHDPDAPPPEGTVGVLGFPVTARMRESVARISLVQTRPPRTKRVLMVAAADAQEYRLLQNAWMPTSDDFSYRCIPSPGKWSEVDDDGSVLMHQEIIQAIVDWVA